MTQQLLLYLNVAMVSIKVAMIMQVLFAKTQIFLINY